MGLLPVEEAEKRASSFVRIGKSGQVLSYVLANQGKKIQSFYFRLRAPTRGRALLSESVNQILNYYYLSKTWRRTKNARVHSYALVKMSPNLPLISPRTSKVIKERARLSE